MSQLLEKRTFAPDLEKCAICGRRFATERIKAHELICQKSSAITKRCFDVTQQRIKGTEPETLPQAPAQNGCFSKSQQNCSCGMSTKWRDKHEDVMKKIKTAKDLAHEKNQKQSDLPFPPPTNCGTDKESIQCQYCSRQINQASAPRHVATCAIKMCQPKRKMDLQATSAAASSVTNKYVQKKQL